ncbi:MAG TPA: cold shock domain-containing protein, partial [Williamwhitmania sp.]|nr:cold shock domain-containing protein [Williamwhitmania sp.]
NKKQVRTNKEKKRKEKELKRIERKESGTNNFDDMIAYVDENGMLTSTRPDPMNKQEIEIESIEIGIPRSTNEPVDVVRHGVVSFFNDSKGFGFIKDLDTQESIFVHINGLLESIKENNRVTFEVEKGQRGLIAVKVKIDK